MDAALVAMAASSAVTLASSSSHVTSGLALPSARPARALPFFRLGAATSSNPLLLAGYAERTAMKYAAAVARFGVWMDAVGRLPTSYDQLDLAMSDYFLELWKSGRGKAEASCCLFGADMMDPGVKGNLHRARRCLRGFHRLKPSVARPPMPWTVACAVAFWLASHRQFRLAVLVVLSFECYLRSGEVLRLVREDFATGADARLGLKESHRMHVHLRTTKTGEHQGVEVRDPHVRHLVQQLLLRTKPGQRVFPIAAATYRRWFHLATAGLGLSADYVPHSLRHGGATRDYLNDVPIADVMVRGRWRAPKSAVHYIQQGRQLQMLRTVPPFVDAAGRSVSADLAQSLLAADALSQSTAVGVGTTPLP